MLFLLRILLSTGLKLLLNLNTFASLLLMSHWVLLHVFNVSSFFLKLVACYDFPIVFIFVWVSSGLVNDLLHDIALLYSEMVM